MVSYYSAYQSLAKGGIWAQEFNKNFPNDWKKTIPKAPLGGQVNSREEQL